MKKHWRVDFGPMRRYLLENADKLRQRREDHIHMMEEQRRRLKQAKGGDGDFGRRAALGAMATLPVNRTPRSLLQEEDSDAHSLDHGVSGEHVSSLVIDHCPTFHRERKRSKRAGCRGEGGRERKRESVCVCV